jgi:hypothetical protein
MSHYVNVVYQQGETSIARLPIYIITRIQQFKGFQFVFKWIISSHGMPSILFFLSRKEGGSLYMVFVYQSFGTTQEPCRKNALHINLLNLKYL